MKTASVIGAGGVPTGVPIAPARCGVPTAHACAVGCRWGGVARTLRVGVLAACALLAALPAAAHHSFASEYDRNRPVSVTGTVRKVEWRNPHIWLYVDVKDERGRVTTWGFSGAPPAFLLRRGISRDALKPGDVVKVEGFRARDGSNNASGGKVTFADGRSVFTASPEDLRPN